VVPPLVLLPPPILLLLDRLLDATLAALPLVTLATERTSDLLVEVAVDFVLGLCGDVCV